MDRAERCHLKRVLFRTDASFEIGSGHVMRCLSLAQEFRERKASCVFACREMPGDLSSFIAKQGFHVLRLPAAKSGHLPNGDSVPHASWLGADPATDAGETIQASSGEDFDLLVVDHYGIDAFWERKLRSHCGRLLVVDDLADRAHECDFLVDQNFNPAAHRKYGSLTSSRTALLLGPEFAFIRRPIREARNSRIRTRTEIKHILIFLGGSDPGNFTQVALEALAPFRGLKIDVLAGMQNVHTAKLREKFGTRENISIRTHTDAIEELMLQADLAVGACGVTTWERACLGLPTVIVSTAVNQVRVARSLDEAGYVVYLGPAESVSPEQIAQAVENLRSRPERVREMSERSMVLVDGQGLERIAERVLS